MQGITVRELRQLCENPWNGGGGYTPQQVAEMTLDQIMFRLCDAKLLDGPIGERAQTVRSEMAAGMLKPDKDGMVAGRAADGTPIRARIGGKSLVQRLMEEEEAKRSGD